MVIAHIVVFQVFCVSVVSNGALGPFLIAMLPTAELQ